MSDVELRMLAAQHCELRALPLADGSSGPPQIVGYAAVFDTRSELIAGMFYEEFAVGAFDGVLTHDARGLFNHDPNYLLGRVGSKTLRLRVDQRGLAYEIDPPDTQTVRDLVLTPLERGDLSGSSLKMVVGKDTWREDANGAVVRTILRVDKLLDVGPVSFPAYPDASAAQRSLDTWKQSQADHDAVRHVNERAARQRYLDMSA